MHACFFPLEFIYSWAGHWQELATQIHQEHTNMFSLGDSIQHNLSKPNYQRL